MKTEKKDPKEKKPVRQVKSKTKQPVTNKDFDNKFRDETEDENDLDIGKERLDRGNDDYLKDDDDERRESDDEEIDEQMEDDEDRDGEDDDLGSSGKRGGKHRDTSM